MFIKKILTFNQIYGIVAMVGGDKMSVNYNNLWKLCIDKGINKTQLKEQAKISTNAIAKLGKNENVSLDTLEKICKALNCQINDIVEITES